MVQMLESAEENGLLVGWSFAFFLPSLLGNSAEASIQEGSA